MADQVELGVLQDRPNAADPTFPVPQWTTR
jgi:hypothetical protein